MFNYKDWIEEINDYVYQNTGSDDIIYGNYIEWDLFRRDYEEELLSSAGFEIPWGKEISIYEYFCLINEFTNECKENLESEITIYNTSESIFDTYINFIRRDNEIANQIVSEILDKYEVPSGTQYEWELPSELTYWNSSEDELFLFQTYPIELDDYKSTIERVYTEFIEMNNDLTKKLLVLSSLIITENMFKSVIVTKIPNDKERGISEFGYNIIQKEIDKILRGNTEGKNQLFKQLYGVNAPSQNWNQLRNALAHNIEDCTINENEIEYLNIRTGERKTYKVRTLISDLCEFSESLKKIIDEAN